MCRNYVLSYLPVQLCEFSRTSYFKNIFKNQNKNFHCEYAVISHKMGLCSQVQIYVVKSCFVNVESISPLGWII